MSTRNAIEHFDLARLDQGQQRRVLCSSVVNAAILLWTEAESLSTRKGYLDGFGSQVTNRFHAYLIPGIAPWSPLLFTRQTSRGTD